MCFSYTHVMSYLLASRSFQLFTQAQASCTITCPQSFVFLFRMPLYSSARTLRYSTDVKAGAQGCYHSKTIWYVCLFSWQVWSSSCTSKDNKAIMRKIKFYSHILGTINIFACWHCKQGITCKKTCMRLFLCCHFYIHLQMYDKDLLCKWKIWNSSVLHSRNEVNSLCRWCCRKHEADEPPVESEWYSRLLNLYSELLINKLCHPD